MRRETGLPAASFAVAGPRAAPTRLPELYARHVARAEALAYLLTGDRNLSQDLAQEAFVRVAGRFHHLRDPSAFDAYLRRTVVNLCRSSFRRARTERAYLARERSLQHASTAGPASHDVETRDQLTRALLSLPHRQRAAIVLRYYEDLTRERVGEVLRCSPRAVSSLVSRGMESLRRDLRVEDGGEET